MSGMSLLASTPQQWVPVLRPYLQRADEFQLHEPVVAYFLRTHAAFLCLQKRNKADKEATTFLMKLLDTLEKDKQALGDQLAEVDGRTVLTKFALMLFARADDDERTGKANMSIVRMFYTASVLFEATGQFMEGGTMDPIAAEKCRYAKFIAARMKKALDNGEPYVSPNKMEAPLNGGELEGEANSGPAVPMLTTAPPSTYMPPPNTYMPPPLMSAADAGQRDEAPPPYTIESARGHEGGGGGSMGIAKPSAPSVSTPSPTASTRGRPASNTYVAPAPAPAPAPSNYGGPAPSPELMMDAQKHARQAVSALQFYDYKSARAQLLAAINTLDGKK